MEPSLDATAPPPPPSDPPESTLSKVARRCIRSFVSYTNEDPSKPPQPPNYDFSYLLLALKGTHSLRLSFLTEFSAGSPPESLIPRPRFSTRVFVPDVLLPPTAPAPSPFRPFPVPAPPSPKDRRRRNGCPPLCVIDVFPVGAPQTTNLLTSQPRGEDTKAWFECKHVPKGFKEK